MKLVKQSKYVPGAYDQYTLHSFNISKLDKSATAMFILSEVQTDGTSSLSQQVAYITNNVNTEKVVDPTWNEKSTPAKPANFSLTDISTWGTLTYDDIPFIDDETKKYYDKFITIAKEENMEKSIFMVSSLAGFLPDFDNTSVSDWNLVV